MSKQEILTKAIQKAVKNGWEPFEFGQPTSVTQWHDNSMVEIAIVFPLHENPVEWVRELEGIIYNHDFAKALWGDNPISDKPPLELRLPKWQYHLQRMVISDDPIKYLGENLD